MRSLGAFTVKVVTRGPIGRILFSRLRVDDGMIFFIFMLGRKLLRRAPGIEAGKFGREDLDPSDGCRFARLVPESAADSQ